MVRRPGHPPRESAGAHSAAEGATGPRKRSGIRDRDGQGPLESRARAGEVRTDGVRGGNPEFSGTVTEGGQLLPASRRRVALYTESFVAQNALPDDPTPVPLLTTPLDSWHRRHGARMVAFAGYAMPVLYDLTGDLGARCRGGVMAEHLHTATAGTVRCLAYGAGNPSGTEWPPRWSTGARRHRRPEAQAASATRCSLNEAGGIIDDLMVARLAEDRLFLVVNASRKDLDFTHLAANLPGGIAIARGRPRAAGLAGPEGRDRHARLAPEAAALPFMGVAAVTIGGIDCLSPARAIPARTASKFPCPPRQPKPSPTH